ncbi:MAG: LemA family protein [Roseibacillus sp.]
MSQKAILDCEKCGTPFPSANHAGTTCSICNPPKESLGKQKFYLLKILALIGLVIGGIFLQTCSYKRIAEVRQIARIPQTSVAAAVPGEVNLAGRARQAEPNGRLLSAPDSSTECLYFSYLKEREDKDSDGDTTWVTVDSRTEFVPFDLRDGSGLVRVEPSQGIDFNIEQSHRRQSGRYRYTEHRIDPGDRLFIFGLLEQVKETNSTHIIFDKEGDYTPIISEKSEQGERNSKSIGSIWLCWLGLGLLAGAASLLFGLLGLHRILLFFGLLSFVVSSVLFYQGFRMMKSDLVTAHDRIQRQEVIVRELFQKELTAHQASWDGSWSTLGDVSDYQQVPAKTRTRLRRVRIDFASATRRVEAQSESFPYTLLVPFLNLPATPEVPLTPRDEDFLQKLDQKFIPAKISQVAGIVGICVSLALGLASFFFGFRTILRKRLLENLPTTPAAGVSYGLTEIGGFVDLPDGTGSLTAPLSGKPCTYFHYTIKEKRGSGKNAKWVTIHNETQKQRFLCRDQSGAIPIDPEGANMKCWQTFSRREGRQAHTERFLKLGDPLHALGYARLDEDTGDSLLVAKPESKALSFSAAPFILSSFCENSLLRRGGMAASLILCLTFSAVLFAGLMLFATMGAFNPASYLAAAAIGPALMILFAILLHYNDLVFLRERAKRAWSNIEVALQKRSDLIPALNEIAKTTLAHEKNLQEDIAQLRVKAQRPDSARGFGKKLTSTHQVSQRLLGLAEAYPDLAAGETLNKLARQLAICENEIAFASTSFNDSVETYNTRIATLPDMVLAKAFRLRPFDLLNAQIEKIEL